MEGEAKASTVEPVGGGAVEEPDILLECVGCAEEPEADAVGRGEYVGVREGHFGSDPEFVPPQERRLSLSPSQFFDFQPCIAISDVV